MDTQHPSLFPAKPVLEQRLGPELFDPVPASPGVYRFFDEKGELLYVGKSKNLRRRLFSYKRAKAGQVSGKVSRLISRIAHFVYEVTESERDALLLENRLIRELRPPFNHANKEPETYYYLLLKPVEAGLRFRLSMRIHEEDDTEHVFGCFKGHTAVRRSAGCLLRLLFMAEHGLQQPIHLPVLLTRNLTPANYTMPWHQGHSPGMTDGVNGMVCLWLRGESPELIDWLVVQIDCGSRLSLFQSRFLEYHLECLMWFYEKKLVPHRLARGKKQLLTQNELDDRMVENAFEREKI